ncbi:MAG: hypothetical protein IBJ14_01960 [Hydrogenophaga sp.]|nr:hypothetical protein [Hydrogenophaga sp.]
MKHWLLNKGRLTGLGTLACVMLAAALVIYTFFWANNRWMGIVSLVLALALLGFASMCNSAASIGVPPPFDRDPLGWRKAKKTYEAPDDIDKSEGL